MNDAAATEVELSAVRLRDTASARLRTVSPRTWALHAATEQGPRSRNEDAFLLDAESGIAVVCDGMGRHAGGDVASRLAAQTVLQELVRAKPAFEQLARADSPAVRAAAQAAMVRAVSIACHTVYEAARADPAVRDMGTTVDAVVVSGRFAVLGHVGDGRVMLLRDGQVHPLTEDHSLVAAQLKAGTISAEEALSSPFRSVLVRSVGQQPNVEVDTGVVECVPGDVLLACSDGLHGVVPPPLLLALAGSGDASAPRRLLEAAREGGTRDNSTCIVLVAPAARKSDEDLLAVGKVDALRKVPLFDQFDYREKQAVLAIAGVESARTGQVVVNAGEAGGDLFVVVRGRVAVEAGGRAIAELSAGSHFGEMGLVDDTPRSATVRALEPTALLRIPRGELWALMQRSSEIGHKLSWGLVQSLAERLRWANEQLSRK